MHAEYRFRRLALWALLASLAVLAAAPAGAVAKSAGKGAQVFVVLLPNGTKPAALERYPALAPGSLSAGIGDVPPEQTYIDIGQGNRVSERLYDEPLSLAQSVRTEEASWNDVVERANAVPADLVPGLLAESVKKGDHTIAAGPRVGVPALIAVDPHGALVQARAARRHPVCAPTVCVFPAKVSELGRLIRALVDDDLLIAIERAPPAPDRQLTIGIAGQGFGGNLTSDSTRLRGYVLSTDIAPTILERLRVPIPSEMSGEPIRSEGDRDVAAVISLQDRLASIVDRRGSVIGISALIWIAVALIAVIASGGAVGRAVARILALTGVYLPLVLLATAAIEPSEGAERLIVFLATPLLAAFTIALLPGYRALAVACGVTVAAFAIDVIAGSPLTRLSLLGSNPGLGVRFYGIGNELEATLVPLILVGTGAAVAAWRPRLSTGRAATAFAATALVFAFVFAFGRFGADVGIAIVLPVGAAAAAAALRATQRTVWLLVAAPLAALAVLALLDLVLGGDAHLTRSVLDAGGLQELGDVAERRLRLSADSFGRALDAPLFWVAVTGIALAVWQRRRILAWFEPSPPLRAGFIGAVVAVAVAIVANDSGALLLEVGTIYLLLLAGYAWAEAAAPVPRDERN